MAVIKTDLFRGTKAVSAYYYFTPSKQVYLEFAFTIENTSDLILFLPFVFFSFPVKTIVRSLFLIFFSRFRLIIS